MSLQARYPTHTVNKAMGGNIDQEAHKLYVRAMNTSSLEELRRIRDELYTLYIKKPSTKIHIYISYVEGKIIDLELMALIKASEQIAERKERQ